MSRVNTDILRKIAADYDILTLLGEGGMGTVYRIRHRKLDEIRVAKIMHKSLQANPQLAERFHREAKLLSDLRHPNIARVFEFFVTDEDQAAIIMEWVPGEDLGRLGLKLGPAPVGLVLEVGRQTLLALEHLHSSKYVHRDISPDNLMLVQPDTDTGVDLHVKMIDLGIAKALDDTVGMTATGNFLGKVRYTSPERLSPDGALDQRSDLYSLSVVLYEFLTGACPIRGKSPQELISGHLFHNIKPFEETDPEGKVPEPVQEILLQLLAKKPAERPGSATELLERWQELQGSFPLDPEQLNAWSEGRFGGQEQRDADRGDETIEISSSSQTDSLMANSLKTDASSVGELSSSQAAEQESPAADDFGPKPGWESATTVVESPTSLQQLFNAPKPRGRQEQVLIWWVGLAAITLLGMLAWWIL